ncbi:hypothetical protein OG288_12350 [Streptomyces tauricus]|uniref:Secreted protein n=1 Tax=Streptomyces tauricus TaxID=68274 RepID=A0ABZ1JBN7_9ACTN|nr:hypothetical protein [Streptomyces tauricus]
MRRIAIISSVSLTAIAATTGLALWLNQPSYDEIADSCTQALQDRPAGDKAKPDACDGLTQDDYNTLLMSHVMDSLGWTDEDGNFDKNKMLEDSLND